MPFWQDKSKGFRVRPNSTPIEDRLTALESKLDYIVRLVETLAINLKGSEESSKQVATAMLQVWQAREDVANGLPWPDSRFPNPYPYTVAEAEEIYDEAALKEMI